MASQGSQHLQGQPPASENAVNDLKLVTYPFQGKRKTKRHDSKCVVCQDGFSGSFTTTEGDEGSGGRMEALMMPCRHVFHKECLVPWLKMSNTCPTCRFEVSFLSISLFLFGRLVYGIIFLGF
jgi:E3 ubiquitin-protein ligase RNF115/126